LADQDPTLEGADNSERPEWLPENFTSPEDLLRSYQESQRKITEQGNQMRGLEEAVNTMREQQEQFIAQQNQPDPYAVQQQWQEQLEADPVSTMAQIAALSAQQAVQQYAQAQQPQGENLTALVAAYADNNLAAKYGDEWGQYKEKVSELIASDALFQNDSYWTNPQAATAALERAYQIVRADDVLSGNTVVQQQMADTRQMKFAAQTASPSSGNHAAPNDDASEWAKIVAAAPKPYYEQ